MDQDVFETKRYISSFGRFGMGCLNEILHRNNEESVSNLKLKATYGLVGNDAISSNRFYYFIVCQSERWR